VCRVYGVGKATFELLFRSRFVPIWARNWEFVVVKDGPRVGVLDVETYTKFYKGYLGSIIDEERRQLRYVM